MLGIWLSLAATLLYLELVFHISGFGMQISNPLFTMLMILSWSAVETLLVGLCRGKIKTFVYQLLLWMAIVWTGVQTVYLHIFKQPLLWEAVFRAGQDALTNYWREALRGFCEVLPTIGLLLIPGIVISLLQAFGKWKLKKCSALAFMRMLLATVISVSSLVIYLKIGKVAGLNFYEDYKDFFDPLAVVEELGVHAALQRDTFLAVDEAVLILQHKFSSAMQTGAQPVSPSPGPASDPVPEKPAATPPTEPKESPNAEATPTPEVWPTPEVFVPSPQVFELDFDCLRKLADDKMKTWVADYIEGMTPTKTNEYTGVFEGYNLIFLTAEGFSPYAVREDLTPTLYHLIHTGFVFDNYYVPLWQTSTSDGEYINLTGLIPCGQFSMQKSAKVSMPYNLAAFFNNTGIQSRAYHNNNLSYYDRHLSHPNLGYFFKSCNLGGLDPKEWGDHIFEMETSDRWPQSDYEMMVSTLPEFLQDERFYAYYMTVSGHMNYNFRGNYMSAKNRAAVENLDMSENAKAYLACNIELDKALAYLIDQLEAAGKLETTVIVLSADHYPYAMTNEEYEELAGRSLNYGKDLFRNNLILWNKAYEENPVTVTKACGPMDLLPTLLNLFGFDFDSRMYAGRDIFSDAEGMVIFNDKSFVTDRLIYNRKTGETIWRKDENGQELISEEQKEEYLANRKREVNERYVFSSYILQTDFYKDIEASRTGQ